MSPCLPSGKLHFVMVFTSHPVGLILTYSKHCQIVLQSGVYEFMQPLATWDFHFLTFLSTLGILTLKFCQYYRHEIMSYFNVQWPHY